jgi:hypothetical protein
MNSLEAKFILEARRSGELDASDAKLAEALQAMETDPELARWVAAVQDLDRAITAKLKAVPVPADLAGRIRVGGSTTPPPSRRLARRHWLGLAAALVALAVPAVLLVTRARPGPLADFRNDMADFMDRRWDRTFDLSDPEYANVKAWLESRSDLIQIDVPLTLAASRTIGCKTLKWRGNNAALICFSPKGAGAVVHILVVNRRALIDAPGEEPQSAKLPTWNSAIWSRGDKVYLALTTADSDRLTGCL